MTFLSLSLIASSLYIYMYIQDSYNSYYNYNDIIHLPIGTIRLEMEIVYINMQSLLLWVTTSRFKVMSGNNDGMLAFETL